MGINLFIQKIEFGDSHFARMALCCVGALALLIAFAALAFCGEFCGEYLIRKIRAKYSPDLEEKRASGRRH